MDTAIFAASGTLFFAPIIIPVTVFLVSGLIDGKCSGCGGDQLRYAVETTRKRALI